MALHPTLSYSERNNNKALTLTDTTADWGVAGNINVVDVTSLTLNIDITTSDNVTVSYEPIDLVDLFGDSVAPEFNAQSNMVFDIDASMLLVGTTPLGTLLDTELPDGIWNIVYTVNGNVGILTENVLIDGKVRAATYELLRAIPTIYNCSECKSKTVLDAIYCYALLNVLQSDAYAAKTEELISLLYTLERLVTNGSNYTW